LAKNNFEANTNKMKHSRDLLFDLISKRIPNVRWNGDRGKNYNANKTEPKKNTNMNRTYVTKYIEFIISENKGNRFNWIIER